jgi:hypothetical protein
MEDGAFRVKVEVFEANGSAAAESTVDYTVTSRITGDDAVISPTAHPLVALYSIPPCTGQARVQFRATVGGAFQITNAKPCRPGQSVNFHIAGMRATTQYVMRHVITNGGSSQEGPLMSFTTGTPTLTFPTLTVPNTLDAQTSLVDDVLLQSVLVPQPPAIAFAIATDLSGRVIWYHDESQFGVATSLLRPVWGGTMLLAAPDGPVADQLLREIDLVGSIVRETNVPRVNEQLAARGENEVIGSFHHEATRLPNGDTVVLASIERVMDNVQGASGPVDVLGDMILVLDLNWQVKWHWNAFDHLDVGRKAILSETCTHQAPGCPPLLTPIDGKANDWTHGNAVTYSPQDGNLVFSMRHQDWVIKVDYANGAGDGSVVWRLGQGGDFAVLSQDPSPWFTHQHDARYVGPGVITLFDNGNTRCAPSGAPIPGCNSRGQVYAVNEVNKTAALLVNADLGGYSFALGSAERLSNGNYDFGSGFLGSPPTQFAQAVEVRPNGSINYVQQTQAGVYRYFRMRNFYMP